jgi:hypothetical protein
MTAFGRLVRERQAVLMNRMAALEALCAAGETSPYDVEYDRLTDELRFLLAIANARLDALQGVHVGRDG